MPERDEPPQTKKTSSTQGRRSKSTSGSGREKLAKAKTKGPAAPPAAKKTSSAGGRKPKNKDLEEQLKRATDELAALKTAMAKEKQGSDDTAENEDPVERIDRPRGEAGDKKNGFILQDAMGLEDDREEYEAILRTVRTNVVRANLDVTVDFRQQDPSKLAAVYKLTRKAHPYLTQARFPMDWATAEITKQYIRNKRRYGVKKGRIENRETRKRKRQGSGAGGAGASKRQKTSRHIDDLNSDEDDDEDEDEQGVDEQGVRGDKEQGTGGDNGGEDEE